MSIWSSTKYSNAKRFCQRQLIDQFFLFVSSPPIGETNCFLWMQQTDIVRIWLKPTCNGNSLNNRSVGIEKEFLFTAGIFRVKKNQFSRIIDWPSRIQCYVLVVDSLCNWKNIKISSAIERWVVSRSKNSKRILSTLFPT